MSTAELQPDAPDKVALDFARETERRAHTNARLAESNLANVWPWRWRRWYAIRRLVLAEQAMLWDRIAQSRAWRAAHAERTGVEFVETVR